MSAWIETCWLGLIELSCRGRTLMSAWIETAMRHGLHLQRRVALS